MIPSVDYRSQYLTDGAGTIFGYGFPLTENGYAPAKTFLQVIKTDLVTLADTVLVVDTDYTVNGIGSDDPATWTITLPVTGLPLPSGSRITLIPNLPPVQMEDLSSQGSARPDRLESMDDYLTLLVQQAMERLSRAVITPAGSGATDYDPNAFLADVLAAVAAAGSSATASAASAATSAGSATAAAGSAAAAATSAASIQPFDTNQYATSSGTNTYTAALTPAVTSYVTGMHVAIKIGVTNTGSSTISLNGLGAKSIVKNGASLAGGEMVAGQVVMLVYDGTIFNLISPSQAPIGHGQVRFNYVSATSVILLPYNGNRLTIAGVSQAVPSAGVAGSNSGLSASTFYYVYAYMSAGVMTLEFSATGHSTDASTGVEIKTADSTRTLVGAVYTTGSSQFALTDKSLFTISWFNRKLIGGSSQFTANPATASTSYIELGTTIRGNFIAWRDDLVQFGVTGYMTASPVTGAGSAFTQFVLDGGTVGQTMVAYCYSPSGAPGVLLSGYGIQYAKILSAENAVHYLTLFGKSDSGGVTWTWNAGVITLQMSING